MTVTFIGCGNVEITGPADQFPVEVTLLIYNPGQDQVNTVTRTLDEGERPGSPGGQLIGIETPFGTFTNPNFNFGGLNCGDSSGQAPGEPGDPRDELSGNSAGSTGGIPTDGFVLGTALLLFSGTAMMAVYRRGE